LTAQFVLQPRKFSVAGEIQLGSLSLNTVTRPDSRGKGLFTRLAKEGFEEWSKDGRGFVTGFPNKESIRGFTGALWYADLGTVPFLVRPLRWPTILKGILRRSRSRKGKDLDLVVPFSSVFRNERWTIRSLSFDDARLEGLLKEVNALHRCSTFRHPDYFRWRYASCPTRSYTLLAIFERDEKQLIGYAVLRGVELMGWKCGAVIDLGAREGEEGREALRALMDLSVVRFRRAGMDLAVAACMTGYAEYEGLRHAGFIRVPDRILPQPLHFILRSTGSVPQPLIDFGNWFLTFGDYDVL